MAASKIGGLLQGIVPGWLIIVGGLNFQLDLRSVQKHPIVLPVANKLVYFGHVYSFSYVWLKVWNKSYKEFKRIIINHQLFVRDLGVPFILG